MRVRFRFFSRVLSLRAAADGGIDQIALDVQATPLAGADAYQPLITDPQGHRVWPPGPLYAQLENGAALEGEADDFESAWAPNRAQPAPPLVRGVDFTDVILAISVGALPAMSEDLASKNAAWKDMLEAARTIPVAGVQIWSALPAAQIGAPSPPALDTAYAEPFATWADMSFLLSREVGAPKMGALGYLCAPLSPQAAVAGQDFAVAQRQRVEDLCDAWLGANLGRLLPGAVDGHGAPLPGFMAERFVHANENAIGRLCAVAAGQHRAPASTRRQRFCQPVPRQGLDPERT